jgi:hypothetical protein
LVDNKNYGLEERVLFWYFSCLSNKTTNNSIFHLICGYVAFFCPPKRNKRVPIGSAGYAGSLAASQGRASRETRALRSNSAACFFRPFPVGCDASEMGLKTTPRSFLEGDA